MENDKGDFKVLSYTLTSLGEDFEPFIEIKK